MAPGSPRSVNRGSLSVQPMPMIVEDESAPPAVPERSQRRSVPTGRMSPFLPPSSAGYTSSSASVPDRKSEAPREGIRDQEWIAKRGGWYRIGLTIFVVVALAIGLGVGLTLRLRNRGDDSASNPLPTGLFPAGSYSFTTALANRTTGCTTEASTFTCYPYTVYNASSDAAERSAATFFWVIQPVTSYSYVISSAPNPFVPQFTNVSLTLVDGNGYDERFTFNFTMNKPVVPSAPVSAGGSGVAKCWFNDTVMAATIWTRRRATYPANITGVAAPINASTTFAPWPFEVEISQTARAGAGVPDCRDGNGKPVGDFAVAQDGGSSSSSSSSSNTTTTCGCYYANSGLIPSGLNGTAPASARSLAGRAWAGGAAGA